MAFDVVLTPRRCLGIALVVFGTLYWSVSLFLSDLKNEGPEHKIVPLNDINFNGFSDESQKPSHIRNAGTRSRNSLQLGDDFNHLHWFVQISDIHLSVYADKKRSTDLLQFCQENLDIIKPEVVLLTGDITDAKHENKEGSTQYKDEWKQYDYVLRQSGILEKTVWLDTRGNHDAFDVPYLTSNTNYFKIYSPRNKADETHGTLSYHYLHKTNDGDQTSFISVDACPNPGPKRPFNFFGLVYESEFNQLKEFIKDASDSNQIIFFGHYPTSTIGSPQPGIRQLLGHGAVYLCGHLHTMAGLVPNMYAIQQTGYLELELGDWKDERLYRVLAVDHSLISFVDLKLNQWPIILIMNPKDSQFMIPDHESTDQIGNSTHIRILTFSQGKIKTVRVKINDVFVGEANQIKGPLFVLRWQPLHYVHGFHTIDVYVKDILGNEGQVIQSFSIDNKRPQFDFKSRFLLMSDHAKIFKAFFALSYAIVIVPLLIVKLVRIHPQVFVHSQMTGYFMRFILCWIRRLYLIGFVPKVYYALLIYDIYLPIGPWFIGEILDGQIGACFLYGIFVQGTYIPGTLTYLYGALQLLQFNIPLTLYLGRTLDLSLSANKETKPCCPSRLWPIFWLLDHSFFFVIVSFQLYLVLTGFYRAYGLVALILCPMRTWAVLLAIYLRRQALCKGLDTLNVNTTSVSNNLVTQQQY